LSQLKSIFEDFEEDLLKLALEKAGYDPDHAVNILFDTDRIDKMRE